MAQVQSNKEEIILNTALKIFKEKGYDGTTFQDIANAAGTTKSMINYYFRTKEKLFSGIFQNEFKKLFSTIASFINSELSLKEKIVRIVEVDIDRLIEMPDLPIFIFSEINHNPEIVFKNLANFPVENLLTALNKQISLEVEMGLIRKIEPMELLMNIQSLTIYPFLAKPMLMKISGLSERSFTDVLIQRKKDIPEIIWQSIKK